MKIAFTATNPCHVFELARALAQIGVEVDYYSGYPSWKLPGRPDGLGLQTFPLRTLVTYAALRLPERLRPADRTLFFWQDRHFDRSVSRRLGPADFLHGLPGQCLETFRQAKQLGIRCVLNHASGPIWRQMELVREEYERLGLPNPDEEHYEQGMLEQIRSEFDAADYHCAASSVVAGQLAEEGIDPARIWVVPYGVDPSLFPKTQGPLPEHFHILFAGQLVPRKGIHYLLKALEKVGRLDWTLSCYGRVGSEVKRDLEAYRGACKLELCGNVSREALGEAMAKASVLVLPSVEEAFGLVVAQALQVGIPCIVSDRVGAKDLIQAGENGSIVPFGDVDKLASELESWSHQRERIKDVIAWEDSARKVHELSRQAVG